MTTVGRWRVWLASIGVVFAFGLGVVAPRSYSASDPALQIRGDALEYIRLGSGAPPTDVGVPFRYRVLVPWLAKAMPLPPHRAIQLISMACLCAVLTGLLLMGARLGLGTTETLLGVAGVSWTASILYSFHNPFLTDQFGLMMVTATLAALLERRPLLFAVLVTVGTVGRESVAFIAPAYVATVLWTRDRADHERGPVLLLGLALPLMAFLVPRMLPVFGEGGLAAYFGFYSPSLRELGPIHRPLDFIVGVAMSWGWLVFASLAGFALMGTARASAPLGPASRPWTLIALRVSLALLVAGGLATIVANGMLDPNRQLLGAAPLIAIGLMVFVHAVRRVVAPSAFAAGVAVLAACALVTVFVQVPTRSMSLATRESIPLWAVSAFQLAVVAVSLLALRTFDGATKAAGQR